MFPIFLILINLAMATLMTGIVWVLLDARYHYIMVGLALFWFLYVAVPPLQEPVPTSNRQNPPSLYDLYISNKAGHLSNDSIRRARREHYAAAAKALCYHARNAQLRVSSEEYPRALSVTEHECVAYIDLVAAT